MFGFIIGTACLIGLIRVLRGGRCGYGHGYGRWGRPAFGGGCGGGYGGPCGGGGCGYHGGGGWEHHDQGGWGGHHGGPYRERSGEHRGGWAWRRGGFFLRGLFEQLDTTPGQEKAIMEAVDEMRKTAFQHREELKKSRADIAKAMRSPSFDETVMGELSMLAAKQVTGSAATSGPAPAAPAKDSKRL